MSDLEKLRGELDLLDRSMIQEAARRCEIVREIAAAKAHEQRPLFDRDRERRVFEKARRVAEEAGLEQTTAQRLMGVLIEASHNIQEEASCYADAHREGHNRHFVIVGGRGQMGLLLARAWEARGHRVDLLDKEDDVLGAPAIREADIVVVSVPMSAAVSMTESIGPLVREDALLCDVNSLKGEVCDALARTCRAESVGLHPMFGPSVRSLRRQKVVVCPVNPGPQTAWLRDELGRMGLELIETDPQTHDRMMAVVQVLVHYSTLVMGEALRASGVTVEDSLRFTSPIYRLELAFVSRLFAQSADLYAEIEMSNPNGPEVRQRFLEAARTVEEAIATGDRAQFAGLFHQVTSYFHGFEQEAMSLSDFIIEALVSQP